MWSSCCGTRRPRRRDGDLEALLPDYGDETERQRRLHAKMHSYQMLRALSKGYLPSNEQLVANLRSFLASDLLHPPDLEVSDTGRRLAQYLRQWLQDMIRLLIDKNGEDQIQDFIWYLSQTRLDVDAGRAMAKASKARTDATLAYQSLRTIGQLMMSNSDFRIFLGDLTLIGRQVFADTASALSDTAEKVAKQVEPSSEQEQSLKGPGADARPPPSGNDLETEIQKVSQTVGNGIATTGRQSLESAKDHLSGDERQTLFARLQQAVIKLRQRPDYTDSVSALSLIVQRYIQAYTQATSDAIGSVDQYVDVNDDLGRAGRNFWLLLRSFGAPEEWDKLEKQLKKVMAHSQSDPDFQKQANEVGASLQQLLSDPDFWQDADARVQALQERTRSKGNESSLRQAVDDLLAQAQRTFSSLRQDSDVARLFSTSQGILGILMGNAESAIPALTHDAIHVVLPAAINALQYIPIPRFELSVPTLDLLLENLILEPGQTRLHSSFLPHRLHLATRNDIDLRRTWPDGRGTASASTRMTLTLAGLTLRAEDVGFWLRARPLPWWLPNIAAEGLTSFRLDQEGIDIAIDLDIDRNSLESILTLRDVRVRIHTFDYTLRHPTSSTATPIDSDYTSTSTSASILSTLLKPFLRPFIRHTLERALAHSIANALHALNRELVFARERLRATRVADPRDLLTFIKAVLARWTPDEDPDTYTRVGWRPPTRGIFHDVWAPGSIVRVWEEQGRRAGEHVDDGAHEAYRDALDQGAAAADAPGWRNSVFDVGGHTV